MLKPIIISYKLTACQLVYLTNTYKPREVLITIFVFICRQLQFTKAEHILLRSLNHPKLRCFIFALVLFKTHIVKLETITEEHIRWSRWQVWVTRLFLFTKTTNFLGCFNPVFLNLLNCWSRWIFFQKTWSRFYLGAFTWA